MVASVSLTNANEHPDELPTPADRQGSAQCWTSRSAPNVPTAQRTDSNKLLVMADLPLAQQVFARKSLRVLVPPVYVGIFTSISVAITTGTSYALSF